MQETKQPLRGALTLRKVLDARLFYEHVQSDARLGQDVRDKAKLRAEQLDLYIIGPFAADPRNDSTARSDVKGLLDAIDFKRRRADFESRVAEHRKGQSTGQQIIENIGFGDPGAVPTKAAKYNIYPPVFRPEAMALDAEEELHPNKLRQTRFWGGSKPVLRVTDREAKFSGLPFVDKQPEGGFLVSTKTLVAPALTNLGRGFEYMQVLDPENKVQTDKEGGRFVEVQSIDGQKVRYDIPNLDELGTEISEQKTYAQAGVDLGAPPGLRHAIGRGTLLGSIWYNTGIGGIEGRDFDVDSILGKMPLPVNFTGNRDRDLELLKDPRYMRAFAEADSSGALPLVVGQTLMGIGEHVGVMAATRGAGRLAGAAATELGAAGLLKSNAIARHFVGLTKKLATAAEVVGGARAESGAMKSGSALVRNLSRGTSLAGLRFGTLQNAMQEVWFGGVSSLWQPGTSVGEGFSQGFDEAVLETVYGKLTGGTQSVARRLKDVTLPRLRASLANKFGTGVHVPVPTVAELKRMSPSEVRRRLIEGDIGELETQARKGLGGFLPSSDPRLRVELERRVGSAIRTEAMLDTADMMVAGYMVGMHFAARQDAEARGEEWSLEKAPGILWRYYQSHPFDPQAVGSSLAMGAFAGSWQLGSNLRTQGQMAQPIEIGGKTTTYQAYLGDLSHQLATRWATNLTPEDWAFWNQEVQPDLAHMPPDGDFTQPVIDLTNGKAPTRFGALLDSVANKGVDRASSEYRHSVGEQLAMRFQNGKGGEAEITGALKQLSQDELLAIYRQLRFVPDQLAQGEVGASRASANRVMEMVMRQFRTQRTELGRTQAAFDEASNDVTGAVPTPWMQPKPAPTRDPVTKKPITGQVADGALAQQLQANTDEATRQAASGATSWALPGGDWKVMKQTDGRWAVSWRGKAPAKGRVHDTLDKAVRQATRIEASGQAKKRGTVESARAKARIQPLEDEAAQLKDAKADAAPQAPSTTEAPPPVGGPGAAPPASPAPGVIPVAAETKAPVSETPTPAAAPSAPAGETVQTISVDDYAQAVGSLRRRGRTSAGFLQREFGWGYARAAQTVNLLRDRGLIDDMGRAAELQRPEEGGGGPAGIPLAQEIRQELVNQGALVREEREQKILDAADKTRQAVKDVLAGKAKIPTEEEVALARSDIDNLWGWHPNFKRDVTWAEYVGQDGTVNKDYLDRGLARMRADAEVARQSFDKKPLVPQARTDQEAVEAQDAALAALEQGNQETADHLLLKAQEQAEEVAIDKELRAIQAERIAQEAQKTGKAPEVNDPAASLAAGLNAASGVDVSEEAPGPFYTGSLFRPGTPEQKAFYSAARATSSVDALLDYASEHVAARLSKTADLRTLDAYWQGAVWGTAGSPQLLELVSRIHGRDVAEAQKAWDKIYTDAEKMHGERVRDYLRTLKKLKDGKEVPLFSERDLKRRDAMEPFMVLAMGLPVLTIRGGRTTVRKDAYIGQVARMVGSDPSPSAKLQAARDFVRKQKIVDVKATGDQVNDAAVEVMNQADAMLAWANSTKWTPSKSKGDFLDVRSLVGDVAIKITRRTKGTENANETEPDANLAGEGALTRPRVLALRIAADLSGTNPHFVEFSVSGQKTGGFLTDTDTPQALDLTKTEAQKALNPDNVAASQAVVDVRSFFDGARRGVETALNVLRSTLDPRTGHPMLSEDSDANDSGTQIVLRQLVSEDPRLKELFDQLPDGENRWRVAVTNAQAGVHNTRKMAERLWAGDKDAPEMNGYSPITALFRALEMRASNQPFPPELVAALDEFMLLDSHTITGPDGKEVTVNGVSEGAIRRMATDFKSRVADELARFPTSTQAESEIIQSEAQRITATPRRRTGSEDIEAGIEPEDQREYPLGETVYLYGAADPVSMLFGWAFGHPKGAAPGDYGPVARRRVSKFLEVNGDKLANHLIGRTLLGTNRVVTRNVGRRAHAYGQSQRSFDVNLAGKRGMLRTRALTQRLIEESADFLAKHMPSLDLQERETFTRLVDNGTWKGVTGKGHLDQMLGRDSGRLFDALTAYEGIAMHLGREAVLSGVISKGQFDQLKRSYIMRVHRPNADGTTERSRFLNPPNLEVTAAIGREMHRDTMVGGDEMQQVLDPGFLVAREFTSEAARINVLRTLGEAADPEKGWGLTPEEAKRTIPMWERRSWETLALPEGAVDPINGKKASFRQVDLWNFVTDMEQAMKAGRIEATPQKQAIVQAMKEGRVTTDFNAKDIETLIEHYGSAKNGQHVLDRFLSYVDAAAASWRRSRTVMQHKHWLLSTGSGIITNDLAGTASIWDFFDGVFRNQGPYADAARGLAKYQEWVKSGRTADLATMGRDGELIAEAHWFLERAGGATLVDNMLEHTDMTTTFRHLLEVAPDVRKLGTKDSAQLVDALMADMGSKLGTAQEVDRKIAALLGNEMGTAADKVRARAVVESAYATNEYWMKLASYLSLRARHPAAAADPKMRELLADDAMAGTADYSEVNPYFREAMTRFTRSRREIIETREGSVSAAIGPLARMLIGVPFLGYSQVITPSLARATWSRVGGARTASRMVMAAALYGLAAGLGKEDQDEVLEAASGSDQLPGLSWKADEERIWRKNYGSMPNSIGTHDATGVMGAWMREAMKRELNKIPQGVWMVAAGPDHAYRAQMVDLRPYLGNHPVELGLRAIGVVNGALASDNWRMKAESMHGAMFQNMWALQSVVGDYLLGRPGKTSTETTLSSLQNFAENYLGATLNPSTAWLSADSRRMFEAVSLKGTTLREAFRGITRPEGEQAGLANRVAGALGKGLVSMREVDARSRVPADEVSSMESFAKWLGFQRGIDTASQVDELDKAAAARSKDQMLNVFRGAFEIQKHQGMQKGGMQKILLSMLNLEADIEQVKNPGIAQSQWKLRSMPTQEMSELGRFVARQPAEMQGRTIDALRFWLDRSYSSGAMEQLTYLATRSSVDGALAQRVAQAIIDPDRTGLLRLMHKELVVDKAQKPINSYYRLWLGLQADLDYGRALRQYPTRTRQIYDELAARMVELDPTHPDLLRQAAEYVVPQTLLPDLDPQGFIQQKTR